MPENLLALWVVGGLLCGAIAASIAESKGHKGGFLLGLVLGPLGLLIVALMPRSVEVEARRQMDIRDRLAELERERARLLQQMPPSQPPAPPDGGDPDGEAFRRWRASEAGQ